MTWAEMTASMAAHGVFEPLVVLTAEAFTVPAEAGGDPRGPARESRNAFLSAGKIRAVVAHCKQRAEPACRDDITAAPARPE